MAKVPKIYIQGAIYYVTCRGDNEEKILEDGADYQAYLELLKKYKQQYGFKLFSFVLMPTHVHLLIELKEGLKLSDIMHDLNSNYTKYFNNKYQRKGHLLQERHKMNLIDKAVYLLYMTVYIHLNPRVCGLVKNLDDYLYSSYGLYIGNSKGIEFDLSNEIEEVNALLSGLPSGVDSYKGYAGSIPAEELKNLAGELNRKIILGGGEFVKRIETQVAAYEAQFDKAKIKKYPSRRFIFSGSILIVILIFSVSFLYIKSAGLRQKYQKELESSSKELNSQIVLERAKIREDLEEKYAADRVSYEAMSRRLEIEKNKVKDLEKEKVK